MRTDVSAQLTVTVELEAFIVFVIAVAADTPSIESLTITVDGQPIATTELRAEHGTRLVSVTAPPGHMEVNYQASVTDGRAAEPVDPVDLITYMRPSRYCESDSLTPTAQREFEGLKGGDLLSAVSSWVGTHLNYIPGTSRHTDGAVSTLLAREGVCRDYAHLVVGLLRALGMPARMAAVYAPGLNPMDFHAIAEAYVDGAWYAVDATTLAPRQNMIRIATGRDTADTAFMDVLSGVATLDRITVTATAEELANDDVRDLVALA